MRYGFGINDCVFPTRSREFILWQNMVRRCYDTSQRDNPRFKGYEGCSVSDEWKIASNFCFWVNKQKGFSFRDCCLDKDILVPGNKIYSPETSSVVPREINMALTLRGASRGEYPLGVHKDNRVTEGNRCYVAKVMIGSLPPITQYFYEVEDAHKFYIEKKLEHLSYLADKYRDFIEPRVFERLKNFTF